MKKIKNQENLTEDTSIGEKLDMLEEEIINSDKKIKRAAIFLSIVSIIGTVLLGILTYFRYMDIKYSILSISASFLVSLFFMFSISSSEKTTVGGREPSPGFMNGIFTFSDEKIHRAIVLLFLLGVLCSLLSPFVGEFAAPIQSMAMVLSILSDFSIGVTALMLLSTIALFASREGGLYLFYVFFTGLILLVIFKNPRKNPSPVLTSIIYTISSIAVFLAVIILESMEPDPVSITSAIAGIILNDIVIMVSIPKVMEKIVFRESDKYAAINNTEYVLLRELKEKSPYEYKRMIHRAHMAERLSDAIGAELSHTRCCAYYQRIGVLRDEEDLAEATKQLIKEHEFPNPIREKILECVDRPLQSASREAVVSCISDELIEKIMTIFESDPKAKPDYGKIVDEIIGRAMKTPFIINSRLHMRDMSLIKKLLRGEKLYYDFLR
ncbi:MAG: hypothetical protein J6P05_01780 [Lachnospiraceae bacterium]|nr:hypothetical protein [Lachnospiraceae bacterium]